MKVRNLIFCSTLILSILALNLGAVKAMPSLDLVKTYEGNVVDYVKTNEWGTLNSTDDDEVVVDENGDFMETSVSTGVSSKAEPKGEKDSSSFKYYSNGNTIKQVYNGQGKICIVTWSNGDITDITLYSKQ
jgi:hypothetical protein